MRNEKIEVYTDPSPLSLSFCISIFFASPARLSDGAAQPAVRTVMKHSIHLFQRLILQ
jgi:hypothetical protein